MVEGLGVGGLRLSVEHIWLRVWDLAFKVQGSGCRAEGGFGFGKWRSGFRVQGSEFRIRGTGFMFQGSGFRVPSSGFRVPDSGIK